MKFEASVNPTKAAAFITPVRWVKENLFNTWLNGLLTLLLLAAIGVVARNTLEWAINRAQWAVIPANMRVFLTGTYPADQLWRIWTVVLSLVTLSGLSAGAMGGASHRFARRLTIAAGLFALLPLAWSTRWTIACAVALLWASFLLSRGRTGLRPWLAAAWVLSLPWTLLLMWGIRSSTLLPRVETTDWGGLTLTLILAAVGASASFPLGVLLALGRQSRLPVVAWVCTGFIELVRGIPLVSVIFMAHLLVPLFIPGVNLDKVVRAMIGFTIFTSAYMAENVRGGLQGVPRGQIEAALAIGMSGTKAMFLIVLPQALRSVVGSVVGQFISLFKDTSLVAIIGLLDLLGVARSVMANPVWLGRNVEVYLFISCLYWIFTYSLSKSSRRLERALGL